MYKYIVVFVTAPSQEVGTTIATLLLEKKVAACVNIVPAVSSFYVWQGRPASDEEVLLIIKSQAALFEEELLPAILAAHPYEVPEVIALPIVMGSPAYLAWIESETGGAAA
jgi:periplasmic divalent cation tolerance protein